MYDPATTNRLIDRANRQIAEDCLRRGKAPWELQRYTQSQIDAAIIHFNELYDPDFKRLKRPLQPDEQQFIQNERMLCALDFRGHWLPHYAWIVDWKKQPVRFTPNVAQSIILDLWAEDERVGNAIWMLQLKARRLGVSTLSELNVTHRYLFQPLSNCVVASADPQKTIEMAGMIRYCFNQQPWWLTPRVNKIKHDIPVEIGEEGAYSTLAIQAGNQFTGVARGAAPNIVHLSELCEWDDAAALIDGALMPAILDDENVFGILESTAKGYGWWKEKWEQTKKDYARGTSRERPVFLPWYVGTDIYPTPADMRKRPIPPDWIPDDRTIKHAERARDYVLANPLLFQHLAKNDRRWQMPREQMWWREMGYQTAREAKKLHIYLAEYCADDFEAFQIQQNPLLDQEIIIGYQERTRLPAAVYTIVGPEIPPALVAPQRDWDRSKPTITVTTKELLPRYDVKYQLIPLRFEGYDTFDEQLKLLVWEMPSYAFNYGVGVDCSEGVGQDNAVINVLREATPMREPGQVAEWAANTVTAFQLWPLILAVGSLYSQINAFSDERKQCRLAIETWTNGAAAQNELQKRGWYNFHPMYYAGDSRKPKAPGQVNRIGVITNAVLRAAIQDYWMTCLKEEAIDLPSPYLVREITTLENVDGKAQAMLGEHDDRWMALGFPLLSLHQGKMPAQQFVRRRVQYAPGLEEDPGIPFPTWTPPDQAKDRPFLQPGVTGRGVQRVQQRLLRQRDRGALARYYNPSMPIKYR